MTRSQINGAETGFFLGLIAWLPSGLNPICYLLIGLAGGVYGWLAAKAGEWLVRDQRRPSQGQTVLGWIAGVVAAETAAFWLFTGFHLGSQLAPFTAIICAIGVGLWIGRYLAVPLIQQQRQRHKLLELPANHPDRIQ